MKNYLKNLKILSLFIAILLVSACKFPDNNPNWQNIKDYKLDKLSFNKTTSDEFKAIAPDAKAETVGGYTIFNTEPTDSSYKRIRVGFKSNKLDWIEFAFTGDVEVSKIVSSYGRPNNINTKYSKNLTYYDYGFFNVAVDKEQKFAKSINIFSLAKHGENKPEVVHIIPNIPDLKTLKKSDFLNLNPGYTIESDFTAKYPFLEKKTADTKSVYTIEKELGPAKSQYQKILLTFNNGLLTWVNIVPQDLSIDKAVKMYGSKYKIEHIDKKHDFYDYGAMILVTDKLKKQVIKIGLVSSKE